MPIGFPAMQSARLLSDGSGNVSWTFPTAYATGVKPSCGVMVENDDASIPCFVTNVVLTNTGISLKTVKSADITVLGLHVLGIAVAASVWVHFMAAQ